MESNERWPGVENRDAYDALAPFYERHWGPRFFWSSTELFLDLLSHRVERGSRILDLCCGTGEFAGWLEAQGMCVTGVDNSARMLGSARTSVPRAQFYQADMRQFNLSERFDAVTCMYNSINQALTLRSLRGVLRSVHNHLSPGGWFLFDFVGQAGYRDSWDADEVVQLDDKVCELRYRYDAASEMALCLVSIKGVHGDGRKVDFELRQRPLEMSDLQTELTRKGFTVIAVHPVRNAMPTTGRYAVLARAVGENSGLLTLADQWIGGVFPSLESATCGGCR